MGDARECVSTVFLPALFLRVGRKTHAKRVQCAYLSLDRNNHRNLTTASRRARAKTESARSDRKREFPQTLSLVVSLPSANIGTFVREAVTRLVLPATPQLLLQPSAQGDPRFSRPDIHYEFTRASSQHFRASESRAVFVSVCGLPTIAPAAAQTRSTRARRGRQSNFNLDPSKRYFPLHG